MKMWRKIIICLVVFFFISSVTTVLLHDRGYNNYLGIDIRQFGFFFFALSWFFSGFLNLIAYLRGKNKGFNLSMMIMFFSTGLLILAIGLLKVLEHFGVIH